MLLEPSFCCLPGDLNVRQLVLANQADSSLCDPLPKICSKLVTLIPSCHLFKKGVECLTFLVFYACHPEYWHTLLGLLVKPV